MILFLGGGLLAPVGPSIMSFPCVHHEDHGELLLRPPGQALLDGLGTALRIQEAIHTFFGLGLSSLAAACHQGVKSGV